MSNKKKITKKRISKSRVLIVILGLMCILLAGIKIVSFISSYITDSGSKTEQIQKTEHSDTQNTKDKEQLEGSTKEKVEETTNKDTNSESEIIEGQPNDTIQKDHVVFIDAGHGGTDKGAMSIDETLYEKDITLDIAQSVATNLSKEEDVQVIISRKSDKDISTDDRVTMANNEKADVFVSIHVNSQVGSSEAYGIETYYTENEVIGSKDLATTIQETLVSYVKTRDRGHKQESITLLSKCNMPAVQVEAGFITNQNDKKNLEDETYKKELAKGIAQGILSYLDRDK